MRSFNDGFAALTRRTFVQLASIVVCSLTIPEALDAHPNPRRKRKRRRRGLVMYRWSGSGRRTSRAALAHAANRRYATKRAALRDLPHPGAHLKLVQLDIDVRDFVRLFVSRRRLVVDLRHL